MLTLDVVRVEEMCAVLVEEILEESRDEIRHRSWMKFRDTRQPASQIGKGKDRGVDVGQVKECCRGDGLVNK